MAFQRTVWLNGSLVPEHEALVSPFDHGLTTGDGCFETLVTCYGTPFAFTRHYHRLLASAEGLGIEGVPARETLFKASRMVLVENRMVDPVRVRITVTSGKAGLGSDRGEGPCTVLVCALPAPDLGETAVVRTVPYVKNERSAVAGLKTISYAENVVALAQARRQGAGEAILGNTKGMICEGTGSNICWVSEGAVHTPPLSSGALNGITRGLMMELCRGLNIPVEETDAPMEMLESFEEVFLTSSTREIQPVVGIDDRRLLPGATTLRLRKAYKDMIEDDLDP